jgi:hypothetical protein
VRIVGAVVVIGAAGCASAGRDAIAPDHLDGVSLDSGVHSAPVAVGETTAPSEAAAAIDSLEAVVPDRTEVVRPSAAGADEEVKVTAPRGAYRDQRLYGDNHQPEWTTERPFVTTRAYVLAPKQMELEQWYRLRTPRGESPDHTWQTEFGLGLPGRVQLDAYEIYGHHGHDAPTKHDAVALEGRWAFADWGRIPLNPAIYLEVAEVHRAPDHIEGKLLVAENLCDWRWAGNLSYDQEMGGARATEIAISTGLSHPIIDSKLNAGVEAKYSYTAGEGFHSWDDADKRFLIGPTLQWRPTDNMHIDVAPLFGLTHSDRRNPRMELYLIFGFDFGPRRERIDRAELLSTHRR